VPFAPLLPLINLRVSVWCDPPAHLCCPSPVQPTPAGLQSPEAVPYLWPLPLEPRPSPPLCTLRLRRARRAAPGHGRRPWATHGHGCPPATCTKRVSMQLHARIGGAGPPPLSWGRGGLALACGGPRGSDSLHPRLEQGTIQPNRSPRLRGPPPHLEAAARTVLGPAGARRVPPPAGPTVAPPQVQPSRDPLLPRNRETECGAPTTGARPPPHARLPACAESTAHERGSAAVRPKPPGFPPKGERAQPLCAQPLRRSRRPPAGPSFIARPPRGGADGAATHAPSAKPPHKAALTRESARPPPPNLQRPVQESVQLL
jgi:hypothetical protein